ncbi:MAG: hypothetical protein IIB27_03125, partial [Chloroflexi bacterium]|nr:hypothetical protein [Chloroflexota bacterium]
MHLGFAPWTIPKIMRTVMVILLVLGAAEGCRQESNDDGSVQLPAARGGDTKPLAEPSPNPTPWLVDVAAASGLRFEHATGATGRYYFPEIAGSGCALFDYDNDGDLDVYAIQAYPLDPDVPRDPQAGMNRLYRNDLQTLQDGSATAP